MSHIQQKTTDESLIPTPSTGYANLFFDIDGKPKVKTPTGDIYGFEQLQSDWGQIDNTKPDFIKNKPLLENGATRVKKHGVESGVTTFLTQGTPNYTFNLASFDYYINGTKYNYIGSSNANPGFLAGESFAYIGVNASGLVIKKNAYFTPTESENTILIGLIRSSVGGVNSVLDIINDYVYYGDEIGKKIYTRYKNFEKTLFSGTAGLITVTGLRPNISGGIYSNDNLDNSIITQITDFPYAYVYHTSPSSWFIGPVQNQDINITDYDNGTTLTATSNNKFVAHTVLRSNINGVKFIVIGNAQYDTQLQAEQSSPNYGPLETAGGGSLTALAKIVYKKGTGIVNIIDIRNNITGTSSTSSGTLQNSYDASATPEITTDNIRGAVSFKGGTGNDNDNIFEGLDNSGVIQFRIQGNGKTGIGIIPTAYLHLKAGGTTVGTAPFKLTSQAIPLTTPEQGVFELIGNTLQFTQLAKRRGVNLTSNIITTGTVYQNTVTESGILLTAEHGANYLEVGKMETLRLIGVIQQSVTGGGVLSFRVKYAGTTIITTSTVSGNIAAGTPFELTVYTTCRSIGTSGTMQVNTILRIDGQTNSPDNRALINIDTTTSQPTEITAIWSVANASNILIIDHGYIESIEPNK